MKLYNAISGLISFIFQIYYDSDTYESYIEF